MSRADERRRAQAARERDAKQHERPVEIIHIYDADPQSWKSRCAGWRGGFHERVNARTDAIWRCRWCAQSFPALPDRR